MSTPLHPESALGLLENFSAHFDLAAVAHAREELTEAQKASLAAFARGDLNDAERKALIPLLAHNTTALEHLAALLKGEAHEEE